MQKECELKHAGADNKTFSLSLLADAKSHWLIFRQLQLSCFPRSVACKLYILVLATPFLHMGGYNNFSRVSCHNFSGWESQGSFEGPDVLLN